MKKEMEDVLELVELAARRVAANFANSPQVAFEQFAEEILRIVKEREFK